MRHHGQDRDRLTVVGFDEISWLRGNSPAWRLLRAENAPLAEVRRFTDLAEATRESCPRLVPWVGRHPMRALQLSAAWEQVLSTVRWIDERQRPGMYLRQVDVPGVDSKFIEGHRGVLTQLLDLQLDPDRVDTAAVDFSARYGFRRKPGYVRFRCTDLAAAGFCGFSEMSVRVDEFAAAPPGITRVYVVENEITYLAFPLTEGAMVIFGAGYAVSVLEPLGWLAGVGLARQLILLRVSAGRQLEAGRLRGRGLRAAVPASPPSR